MTSTPESSPNNEQPLSSRGLISLARATPAQIELARWALEQDLMVWEAGMLALDPKTGKRTRIHLSMEETLRTDAGTIVERGLHPGKLFVNPGEVPDFSDRATLGCLRSQVEDAWAKVSRAARVQVECLLGTSYRVAVYPDDCTITAFWSESEDLPVVLVRALERARVWAP